MLLLEELRKRLCKYKQVFSCVAKGEVFGKAFEHFLFMELSAYRSYSEKDYAVHFWRTKSGLEVDFILGDSEVALEIKGKSLIDKNDLRPLNAFIEEFSPKKAIVVCNEKTERVHGQVRIVPLSQNT